MYIIYKRERKSAGRDYNVGVCVCVCVFVCPASYFLFLENSSAELQFHFIIQIFPLVLHYVLQGKHSVSASTEVIFSVVCLSGMCCVCVSPEQW